MKSKDEQIAELEARLRQLRIAVDCAPKPSMDPEPYAVWHRGVLGPAIDGGLKFDGCFKHLKHVGTCDAEWNVARIFFKEPLFPCTCGLDAWLAKMGQREAFVAYWQKRFAALRA